MSVLSGAQRRWPGGPCCEAVTVPQSCCARVNCCQRRAPGGENDLEAVAGRVVQEMLELHEGPRLGRSSYGSLEGSANQAHALNKALQDALAEAGSLYVIWHPDAVRDSDGVERFRVVRQPERTVVVDFVVGGGLGVVTNRHGSWIVQSPAASSPPAVAPGQETRSE